MAEHAAINQIMDSSWNKARVQPSSPFRPVKEVKVTARVENEPEFTRFNISGTPFTVKQKVLLKYPTSKLAAREALNEYWSKEKGAYYFDRDPALFNGVLNIFRYNVVTIPVGYSEVMFKRELKFWNISWDELEVGSCVDLDEDLESEFEWMEGRIPPPPASASIHSKRRYHMWCFLTDPQGEHTRYRKLSKAYALVNIFLTVIYLTLFGMSTDSYFRVYQNNTTGEVKSAECDDRFHCFVVTAPAYWLDQSLFYLIVYFFMETLLRLIACPNHKIYLKSFINCADIIATVCILLVIPFYLVPDHHFLVLDDITRRGLARLYLGLLAAQVLRIFKIFQVIDSGIPGLWTGKKFPSRIVYSWFYIYTESVVDKSTSREHKLRPVTMTFMHESVPYATLIDGLMVMVLTLKASLKELGLLVIYLMVTMFVFSTLVTFVELHSNEGIPNCLIGYWWAIITMTTVGYGDYHPATPLGYVVGVFCAVTGLIMTALPVAVIGNNFHLYWDHNNKRNKIAEANRNQKIDIAEDFSAKMKP